MQQQTALLLSVHCVVASVAGFWHQDAAWALEEDSRKRERTWAEEDEAEEVEHPGRGELSPRTLLLGFDCPSDRAFAIVGPIVRAIVLV